MFCPPPIQCRCPSIPFKIFLSLIGKSSFFSLSRNIVAVLMRAFEGLRENGKRFLQSHKTEALLLLCSNLIWVLLGRSFNVCFNRLKLEIIVNDEIACVVKPCWTSLSMVSDAGSNWTVREGTQLGAYIRE